MTTITELLPAYTDYLTHERKLARATVWAYRSDLRALERALGKSVESITRNDLRAFMRGLSKQGRKASTIRRTMHGLGTFWKWLYVEGRVSEVVTEYIDLPRKNVTIAPWMSEAELLRFVAVAASPDVPLRESVAWRLLAHTGMRPDELRGLRIADVSLTDRAIVVRNTKSRADRVLPIPEALIDDLRALMGQRPPETFVFGGRSKWIRRKLYQAFDRQIERAGLSDRGFTPYSLRHSFGTHLAMSGTPIHVIQRLMGHKDLSTTMRYLHAAPRALRDAMSNFVLNQEKTS